VTDLTVSHFYASNCNLILLPRPNPHGRAPVISPCLPVSCTSLSSPSFDFQVGTFDCFSGLTNLTCNNLEVKVWEFDLGEYEAYICNCDGPATLSPDTTSRFNVSLNYQATTCPLPDTRHQYRYAPCDPADLFKLCEVTEVRVSSIYDTSEHTWCAALLVDLANPLHHYDQSMTRFVCDGERHQGYYYPVYRCKCDEIPNTSEGGSNSTSCRPRDVWGHSTLIDLNTAFGQLPSAELDLSPIESLP
jgi:hypothetical protein